jgi:hypothetical protein
LNQSTNQFNSTNDNECEFDNQKIKLTKCEKASECDHVRKSECDRSKLCPKFLESDEWQTEEEEVSDSKKCLIKVIYCVIVGSIV